MNQEEKINQLRKTLKARIIPNLPLTPAWLRKEVEKIIDDFEFEFYMRDD